MSTLEPMSLGSAVLGNWYRLTRNWTKGHKSLAHLFQGLHSRSTVIIVFLPVKHHTLAVHAIHMHHFTITIQHSAIPIPITKYGSSQFHYPIAPSNQSSVSKNNDCEGYALTVIPVEAPGNRTVPESIGASGHVIAWFPWARAIDQIISGITHDYTYRMNPTWKSCHNHS